MNASNMEEHEIVTRLRCSLENFIADDIKQLIAAYEEVCNERDEIIAACRGKQISDAGLQSITSLIGRLQTAERQRDAKALGVDYWRTAWKTSDKVAEAAVAWKMSQTHSPEEMQEAEHALSVAVIEYLTANT
jgi:hypothetical protein